VSWIVHIGWDLRVTNVDHDLAKIIRHRVLHSPHMIDQCNNMQIQPYTRCATINHVHKSWMYTSYPCHIHNRR
jgi:hypothetical protein